ncbi:unnamed protein product, partial [Mesorhabditis spiculigera]
MDDADLLALLPEVQDALAGNFEGIECTVGPGPDLSSKPFFMPFPHLGKQITFLPDISHVDNAGFDPAGLHRLPLSKTSAVFTDGQPGAALELVLGRGSDWKRPLIDLFTRLYPSKWAFLVLELENGRTLFHLLSATSAPICGTGKKEDTPDSVDAQSSASPSESSEPKSGNYTLWIVPVSRVFAIPPPKKKVIRRVVKKKSPGATENGTNGTNGTEVVASEKKRVIKKIVKKADGTESVTTETRVEGSTPAVVPKATVVSNGTNGIATEAKSPILENGKPQRQKSPSPLEVERKKPATLSSTEPLNGLPNGSTKTLTNGSTNGSVNGATNDLTEPMTFGYGDIGNEGPKMNGGANTTTITQERKNALLSKYLNGNRSTDEKPQEEAPESPVSKTNGYHCDERTVNGSSGYGSETNGLEAGSSSSSLLTSSWVSTVPSVASLSRSPSTSSTIRPEDFDHASTRTRSERLRQRLASLDRQNGVERSGSSATVDRQEEPGSSLNGADSLTDLRKRLTGLTRDTSFTSSSTTINDKFQSALLASRKSSLVESGQLQPSGSRSCIGEPSRKSRSPPLGPIVEVVTPEGRRRSECDICTDPLINCGCGGKAARRKAEVERSMTPAQMGAPEMPSQSGDLPFVVLNKALRLMSYQELARLRQVHPHWDEICGQMLNSGYYQLIDKSDKLLMRLQRLVQKDPGLYYPTSVLTNIQVHILNQVDVMRAALDEGVGCFPYGILLDKTFGFLKQIEDMINSGKQTDVSWESVAVLAKRASMHYKDNLEGIMEERLGESARLKAAHKLIRLDSFLVETSVQKMEKDNAKTRDDIMWEMEQLQQSNEKLRKDNRELKQNQMKLEARIDILEQKFKTMARLFS